MTSKTLPEFTGEKTAPPTLVHEAGYEEGVGDVQILKGSSDDGASLKLAKDGITVLVPQPSDDPDEPLNWSWTKKLITLSPLIFASLVCLSLSTAEVIKYLINSQIHSSQTSARPMAFRCLHRNPRPFT